MSDIQTAQPAASSPAAERSQALTRRKRRAAQLRKRALRVVAYVLLSLGAAIEMMPLLWMLSTSFKQQGKALLWPPQWLPNPWVLDNYIEAAKFLPLTHLTFNTTYVTLTVSLAVLLTSSMAAYSFARLRYPGRDAIFLLYLATMMIPGQVTMIPNFILMRQFNWIDSYNALIVPACFSAFGTFLLRQFFLTIPYELEDSARIDGATPVRIYVQIMLPLAKPALATLFIITFMGQWNSFLWPLIVTNKLERMTLSVALRYFQGDAGGQPTFYTLMMAGSVIIMLPVLLVYVVGQRYFVQGITLTGISGR